MTPNFIYFAIGTFTISVVFAALKLMGASGVSGWIIGLLATPAIIIVIGFLYLMIVITKGWH